MTDSLHIPRRLAVALAAAGLWAAPVLAQDSWENFDEDGWRGARTCPFGEIAEGGYFCLEIACPEGGPLGFRMRLTEAEVQDRLEGLWTVNRRDAGSSTLEPVPGAPGQYFTPIDPNRDGDLIERMRQGSAGSFTIVNRPVRANRPFSLEGSFSVLTAALIACPEMVAPGSFDLATLPPESPAPDEIIEVVPIPPGEEADDAAEVEAPAGEAETAAAAAEEVPAPPPEAGDDLRDPAARVLEEIEAACVDRGGAFVEVGEDFLRRADFDGDGIEDLEVSYSAAVCDAAAGLYCDSDSCLTHLYLGQSDGTYVRAFEDVYMSARIAPALVITYDAGSPECSDADTPCERTFVWQDGTLVPIE